MHADRNAATDPIRLRVHTNEAPAAGHYDVLIQPGLLDRIGDVLADLPPAHRYAVITDDNVGPLHAGRVADALGGAGRGTPILTVSAGEASKNREEWARLTDHLIESGFGRDSCLVAVGGGVVGDLAGFVAATYMRGIPWISIPTTLLAMLDASVGGKTGLDTAAGKNLVGAFHQPVRVAIDPDTLMTLPDGSYRSSLAEAVKHGVIADQAYFEWIEGNAASILDRDAGTVVELVRRSVDIKAAAVAEDTRESGRRAILNFGHTVAHALERVTRFALPHGTAVGIGMVVEATVGERLGITAAGTAVRIGTVLRSLGLPTDLARTGVTGTGLLEAARNDKKSRASAVRYALPVRIGAMHREADGGWTVAVPEKVVKEVADRSSSAISQAETEF